MLQKEPSSKVGDRTACGGPFCRHVCYKEHSGAPSHPEDDTFPRAPSRYQLQGRGLGRCMVDINFQSDPKSPESAPEGARGCTRGRKITLALYLSLHEHMGPPQIVLLSYIRFSRGPGHLIGEGDADRDANIASEGSKHERVTVQLFERDKPDTSRVNMVHTLTINELQKTKQIKGSKIQSSLSSIIQHPHPRSTNQKLSIASARERHRTLDI